MPEYITSLADLRCVKLPVAPVKVPRTAKLPVLVSADVILLLACRLVKLAVFPVIVPTVRIFVTVALVKLLNEGPVGPVCPGLPVCPVGPMSP